VAVVIEFTILRVRRHTVDYADAGRSILMGLLWDKLFGTYEPEVEAPLYGVIHLPPAATLLGSSLGGYPELWDDMRAADSARSALAIAVGRP
jgi:hypothetical protein